MSKVKQPVNRDLHRSLGPLDSRMETFNHPIKLPLPRDKPPHLLYSGRAHFLAYGISQAHLPHTLPVPNQLSTMSGYATIRLNLCQSVSSTTDFCGHGRHTPQKVMCVLQTIKINLCNAVPSRKSLLQRRRKRQDIHSYNNIL